MTRTARRKSPSTATRGACCVPCDLDPFRRRRAPPRCGPRPPPSSPLLPPSGSAVDLATCSAWDRTAAARGIFDDVRFLLDLECQFGGHPGSSSGGVGASTTTVYVTTSAACSDYADLVDLPLNSRRIGIDGDSTSRFDLPARSGRCRPRHQNGQGHHLLLHVGATMTFPAFETGRRASGGIDLAVDFNGGHRGGANLGVARLAREFLSGFGCRRTPRPAPTPLQSPGG